MVRRTQIAQQAQSFLVQMDSWQIENISFSIALEGRRAKPAPAGDLNNFPHRSLYLLYYKVQKTIQKKCSKEDLIDYNTLFVRCRTYIVLFISLLQPITKICNKTFTFARTFLSYNEEWQKYPR